MSDNDNESLLMQYRAALNDLTPRAEKVTINYLTTIAMENESMSKIIARAIEDQLFNAHPNMKLPILYLMDSILKNVGKSFIPAFRTNIISTFSTAFNQVGTGPEKEKLKRVLNTWRTNPGGYIFPSAILSQIEAAIGAGSAASSSSTRSALINPAGMASSSAQIPGRTHAGGTISQTAILQQIQILVGQKETMRILQPTSQTLNTEISVLRQLAQVLSTQRLDFATLNQIKNQIHPMMTSSVPPPILPPAPPGMNLVNNIGLQNLSVLAGPVGLSSLGSIPSQQLDLASLGLLHSFPMSTTTTNSIKGTSSSTASSKLGGGGAKREQVVPIIPKDVPIIRLTATDINRKHAGLYYHIYEAIELQCKQCALRFPSHTPEGGKATLDAHLDWHFRQKRKQKEKTKKAVSREWYLSIDDWILEQPVEPAVDTQVAPVFFGHEVGEEGASAVPAIPASATQSKCEVCQETLEKYFDDEEDMWMVRGAVKVGEKMYHEHCYKDSSVHGTPLLGKRNIESDIADAAKKVKLEAI